MSSLEALRNRISKLRVNHKIGSRDIANKEILDIAEFLDRWVVKDLENLENLEKELKFLADNKMQIFKFPNGRTILGFDVSDLEIPNYQAIVDNVLKSLEEVLWNE